MVREYIVKISDEIMEEEIADRPQELIRCKDCIHRGKAEKCVVAAISKEQDIPLFFLDNQGEWYCADGKRG